MSGEPPFLRRRWVRVLLALTLLLIAFRGILPFGLEWLLESQASSRTGRVVEVENVDLQLFAGRIHVSGLRVAQALPAAESEAPVRVDPAAQVVGLGALDLDFTWLALLRGEIRLADVTLTEPAVSIVRHADGRIAPFVLVSQEPDPEPEPEQVPEPEEPESEGGAWPVYVDSLALASAKARLVLDSHDGDQVVDLSLDRFGVSEFGFVDGSVVLGGIDIQRPQARVRRDLVIPTAAAPAEEPLPEEQETEEELQAETPPGAPPGVDIAQIVVERAAFTLATDRHELDVGLALDAREANLERPFPVKLRLDLGTEGGFFALDGRLRAIPLFFEGQVSWADLPLVDILDVAQVPMPLSFEAGSSDAELSVAYGAEETLIPESVRVSGKLSVSKIALAEVAQQIDVAWSDLEAELRRADIPLGEAATKRGPVLELDVLRLLSPRLRYERPEPSGDAPDEPEPETQVADAEPEAPKPTDPRLSLELFEIRDGTLDYADPVVEPEYAATLRELDVKVRGLTWPERTLKSLAVASRGPGPASLELSGGLVEGRGTLELTLGSVDLAGFAPYVRPALGQDITEGTLSLHTDLEAVWPDLTAKNDLVVYQLALSASDDPAFTAQFGVPIAVAVALLRDGEGAITLEPEVQFRAGNLQLGPLVREALTEALEGALRAPLKGLTAVGGLAIGAVGAVAGPSDLGFGTLAMKAGTTSLDAGSDARIGAIGDVLAERPTLAIALSGLADPADDALLSQQILAERVASDGDLPELEGLGLLQKRRIRAALRERHGGEPGPLEPEDEAALVRLAALVTVPQSRREALARARALAVRDDLVKGHGVDPSQVVIATAREGSAGVAGDLAVAERTGAAAAPDVAAPPAAEPPAVDQEG